MKRFLVAFALLATLLVSKESSAQTWNSALLQTNPAANAIVADTGPALGDNARKWYTICSSTVSAILIVEHRDAANATNLHSQGFFLPANGTVTMGPDSALVVLNGERVRLRLNAAVTGSLWCSVFLDPA